jgi:DNA (cytosine-5)-methyltransferase 3A
MNVLSLFDGISVARVALDYAGIQVKNYYSAEIDKYAIAVSQKNYPNIKRLGSVCDISGSVGGEEVSPFEPIDLLIGGSPCQDLSIAKKGRKGLDGNRSGLFWEYIRIRDLVKPKWFILENVASMPQKDKDVITEAMGVQPVMFNASLVSAQTRKRLFWTNIKFDLPLDKGILLKDILQPDGEVDERMVNKDKKAYTLTARYAGAQEKNSVEKKQRTMVKVGHIGNSDAQANRVYSAEGKSVTLSANGGGLGAKTGLYKVGRFVGRRLNAEGKREDHNEDLECNQVLEVRDDEKTNNLSTVQKDNVVVSLGGETPFSIRKLTPIECERLQSLPDDYTEGVSNTQRYKCLGNAFNAEVIAHILKNINL